MAVAPINTSATNPSPMGSPVITADSSYGAVTVSSANIFVPTTVDVNCYNHAPQFYRLPGSSRIYLLWEQGARDEDAGGTHLVGVYSDDDGATWSAIFNVQTAFDPIDLTGTLPSHICVMGDQVNFDGRSFFVGEITEITWAAGLQTSRTNMGLMAIEMTGGIFSSPQWTHSPGGGLSLSYWSGSDLSNLLVAMSSPGYIGGGDNVYDFPKITNNGQDFLIECGVYKYLGGWLRVGRGIDPNTSAPLASFIYTQWSAYGVVWSSQQVSTIANAPARISTLKLANGKYCMSWNPDVDRNKLVLATGTDGIRFGSSYTVRSGLGVTPVFPGAYKGGGPQYPTMIERSDGKLLIAYSVWKENIAVSVVTVP